MNTITKEFVVEYAHRLMHHKGACRNIHGHSGRVIITLAAESVDPVTGMIIDFSDLKVAAAEFVDKYDHALVLNQDDALIASIPSEFNLIIVPGEPTAENFSAWIYADLKGAGLPVSEVTFYETAKNCASFAE